ncbi:MAG: PRC-barrel domain-containing protein [Proteobacteria bacterium]|nr:PRC-barrel domain-containing protein [Pseudomonadota bacterium]
MVLRHALLAAVIGSLAAAGAVQAQTPSTAPGQSTVRIADRDMAAAPLAADAKKLIGRSVKNNDDDTIGKIESVYLDANGKVDSVIVGVGGFLGVGERYARLHWKDLKISNNGEKVVVDMTKDQLKAIAPYKYKDQAERGQVFNDHGVWKDSRAAADARAAGAGTAAADNHDRATADKRADNASSTSTGDFNAQGDVSANAIIGTKVKNANKDTVGSVEDLYVDGSGNIKTVVLSVGGFLGVGSKDVAVKWSDLKQTRDGRSVVLTTNMSKDELKGLPDYKYERRQPRDQAAAPNDHRRTMTK